MRFWSYSHRISALEMRINVKQRSVCDSSERNDAVYFNKLKLCWTGVTRLSLVSCETKWSFLSGSIHILLFQWWSSYSSRRLYWHVLDWPPQRTWRQVLRGTLWSWRVRQAAQRSLCQEKRARGRDGNKCDAEWRPNILPLIVSGS